MKRQNHQIIRLFQPPANCYVLTLCIFRKQFHVYFSVGARGRLWSNTTENFDFYAWFGLGLYSDFCRIGQVNNLDGGPWTSKKNYTQALQRSNWIKRSKWDWFKVPNLPRRVFADRPTRQYWHRVWGQVKNAVLGDNFLGKNCPNRFDIELS